MFPRVVIVRHGETEWSRTGQHTGRTDLPLTAQGECDAEALGRRLRQARFAHVLTSPLQRARRTGELAGYGGVATVEPDLVEWDYGEYEGRSTADIRAERPGWSQFRDGCAGGETLAQIAARADRVIARIRALETDVLVFGHRDALRILAVRWIGQPPAEAEHLVLATAALSVLGFDRGFDRPVIERWNDDRHGDGDDFLAHFDRG